MSLFWEKQRVLVTGGAGFVGKFLIDRLKKDKQCNYVFAPRSRDYDLRKEEAVFSLYQDTKPTMVIHLAAVVGGIGANRSEPGRFFYENAIMGIQVMEYARRENVQKFVAVGTICAYPKNTPVPFQEEHLWDGYPEETNAPYGLAKKMLLVQSQAYRAQYGFRSIFLLPVNLYGPGDNFDLESSHVIPALIRKFFEAKERKIEKVILWGDGTPTREFLYADDAAQAIILASEKYDKPDPVNVGAGFEISIKDLALMIQDIIGYKGKLIWDTSKPNGQPRRCLDVSKAKKEFGFVASVGFQEGLQRTIRWYQQNCAQRNREFGLSAVHDGGII